jgi:hypothetical protein
MAGDYTRFTFHPQKDIAGVLMPQGRVLLGSDWNELVEAFDRRFRAETMDIIGRAVVPKNTPDGFRIQVAGADLSIGRGRAYVDGLLAENHGGPPLEFDNSVGETRGQQPVLYSAQPYFPNPPALPGGGPHLVYLDVRHREVTWVQDQDRIDKAVGVDTATCIQSVWQVKVLPSIGAGVTCATPDNLIPGWLNLIAPPAGRLTTAASGVPASTDPCIIPPSGGYRGTENRLYRVEIHTGGPLGTAQFKFSRDNASIASPITAINLVGDTLSVVRIGRDSVLRFAPGDWVEITDDIQEFAGLSGDMRQVTAVDEIKLTITLGSALPAGKYDATKPERHTRVTRWDQKGIVMDPLGGVVIDVDANGGLIPVPLAGSVVLEDGVQVTLTLDPPGGSFQPMAYWCFAARTVDASVELLDHAPPRGILHHFARLAIVTFPGPAIDCRTLWPPDFGNAGCDCTACVTAVGHNSGTATIQAAINKVAATGGKVCLGPGVYQLRDTVQLNGSSIRMTGRGNSTVLVQPAGRPAVQISGTNLTVEEFLIQTTPSAAGVPGLGQNAAFVVVNSIDIEIQRCWVTPPPGAASTDPAIALSGPILGAVLQDNGLFAFAGIVDWQPVGAGPSGLLTGDLQILNNLIQTATVGIGFGAFSTHIGDTRISGNTILAGAPAAILLSGQTAATGDRVEIDSNALFVGGDGIVSGVNGSRIIHNDISPARLPVGGNGIAITRGRLKTPIDGIEVVGNRVVGMSGVGVLIDGNVGAVLVNQNICENLGVGGIVMTAASRGIYVVVENNQILNVSPIAVAAALPVFGIRLIAVEHAHVAGNTIHKLGMGPAATNVTGIQAAGCSSSRLTGNELIEVGRPAQIAPSAGIEVTQPFNQLMVQQNVVRRSQSPPATPETSIWRALHIAARGGAAAGGPFLVRLPSGVIVSISGLGLAAIVESSQITSVVGNLLEAFGSANTVDVEIGGPCIFDNNQCFLDNPGLAGAGGAPPAVVFISADSIIAGNNRVRGLAGALAMPSVAMALNIPANAITVVGNVCSGPISINNAALTPPWAPLNVIA